MKELEKEEALKTILKTAVSMKEDPADARLAASNMKVAASGEPLNIPVETDDASAKAATEAKAEDVLKIDEEHPFSDENIRLIKAMLKVAANALKQVEGIWFMSQKEFGLQKIHMDKLFKFNLDHRSAFPEDKAAQETWDKFNGLDHITEEDAIEIFGKDHPIIGIENTITIDRVKSVANDLYEWISASNNYKSLNDSFTQLLEGKENLAALELKERADKETDPLKKKKMLEGVALYHNRKNIDFIADPIPTDKLDYLIKAFSDAKKISYLIKRCKEKLASMHINAKVILEISQFEKRFMDEKYHDNNNMLLLYFMNIIVYGEKNTDADNTHNKVMCIIMALDKIIRNTATKEFKDIVIKNIEVFEDQFIGKLPVKKAEAVAECGNVPIDEKVDVEEDTSIDDAEPEATPEVAHSDESADLKDVDESE